MMKPILVGVDVSADTLSVVLETRDQQVKQATFSNDPAGHHKLCRLLRHRSRSVRVCLEATGIYSLDLALALHRAKGIEVMVANPRATRDFARARMQRAKTDATDAHSILEFLKRMPFKPWVPPTQEILDLRALSRRITALKIAGAQERNRLHATGRCRQLTEVLRRDITAHIDHLHDSVASLTEEAVRIIRASPALQTRFEHLCSIKGIATVSALHLLAELSLLPPDMEARQWVAHAGIDPRPYESGTSVHKPGRISRTGNRHLRAALYMPALVASRWEPNVRAFYEKLLAKGKKPMQAIVAVMRKLLHAVHGMFHHDADFNGEKFFAISA
jgi:transposase